MKITLSDPIDKFGRINPVRDLSYVGQPVIGHIVRMEDGFYAIADRDEVIRKDTKGECIEFIRRKWQGDRILER